jgi:hypothetical protein
MIIYVFKKYENVLKTLKIAEFFLIILVRAGAGAGIFDKLEPELEPELEPDKNGSAPQHWLEGKSLDS